MYTHFYGLREKPFALVPDTRYLYLSDSHREALAHVLYGIREGEGFIEVVGQVGTGKTTLCRTLLERIEKEVDIGFIFNPPATELELLSAINRELGIPADATTRTDLIETLNRFLVERRSSGRRVVLVIDEAQNLTPRVLEQVRLLSNLETERGKLLQILLLGQPELDQHLARKDLRQLRQRITVRWELLPLSLDETEAYVEHRLRVAGCRSGSMFASGGYRALFRVAEGIPRVVNAVADRALLIGYAEGRDEIDARIVRRASRELPGGRKPRTARRGWLWASASAVALAGVAAALVGGAPLLPRFEGFPAPASVDGAPPVQPEVATADGIPPPAPPVWQRLQGGSASGTAAEALDTVLRAWGYEALGLPAIDPTEISAAIGAHTGLRVLETWTSGLDRVWRLDLPAILELEPSEGSRRYAALVGVGPDGMIVLSAGGETVVTRGAELEPLWTGRSLLPWANFDAVPDLARGAEGTPVLWLQERLASLGYLPKSFGSGKFDADTRAAVRRFQARHALDPTGEIGPSTLITIYQTLGYGAPSLGVANDLS